MAIAMDPYLLLFMFVSNASRITYAHIWPTESSRKLRRTESNEPIIQSNCSFQLLCLYPPKTILSSESANGAYDLRVENAYVRNSKIFFAEPPMEID